MDDQLKNQMLDLLMGSLSNEAKKFATEEIEKIKEKVEDDLKKMKDDASKLKEELDRVLSDCPTVITVGTVESPKKELTHSCFDTVVKVLASARRKEKNIMLVGGAGGGKTHLVSQIAESLKLPFYPLSVGLQTTKSDLLGFINATGQYMPSCVRLAYENGGVLLLDEFDSAHAGVVTILNGLLANGHCSFPDKVVNKHKDFVCLVACNTYGTGANLDYIGRNRLDGATLDRFVVVDVDYDKKLEKRLTGNKEWYSIVNKIRKNAEDNGIKIIISPRACMDGADLIDGGFSVKEVIDMTIFKGCNEDIRTKLLKGVSLKLKKDDDKEDTTTKEQWDVDLLISVYLDTGLAEYTYNPEKIPNVLFDTWHEFKYEDMTLKMGSFEKFGVFGKHRLDIPLHKEQFNAEIQMEEIYNGQKITLKQLLEEMNGKTFYGEYDLTTKINVHKAGYPTESYYITTKKGEEPTNLPF